MTDVMSSFSPKVKKSHSSLHWDCIPFFVECNQSENQFKENLKTSNKTKAKTESKCVLASCYFLLHVLFSLARVVARVCEAQSPWKNLEGRPNRSLHKKSGFLAPANEIRMRSLVPRERKNALDFYLKIFCWDFILASFYHLWIMVLFCGVPVVIPSYLIQLIDYTVGPLGSFFNFSKDMASSEVMETVNWSTIKLSYKLEVFKLMFNAYKNILPDSLCGNIFSKRDNCYSLRGHEVAAIRRYKSRFNLWKTH